MGYSKKILHIVPDFEYGGVEKVILNYYAQLDHCKYHFDYVTHGEVADFHQGLVKRGSKIYYFKTIGRIGYKKYKEQIKKCLNIVEYDIIHIHVGYHCGVYASIFKSLNAKKIICHAHTTRCVNKKHNIFMPFFRFLARYNSSALIACGKDAGRFCFGRAKYHLLPNGINFNCYKDITIEDTDKVKKELGISKDSFVIGHVGRFTEQKNHKFIVQLIEKCLEKDCNITFVLVGDGPLRNEIVTLISKIGRGGNVIFAGIRKDVPILMKMFDVFILPSLFEGLPVVGIEAQAAGTPCIISDTIDSSLDMGLGLTTFLSLDTYEKWVEMILSFQSANREYISNQKIYTAFVEHGYEMHTSAKELGKIYDSL